MLTSSVQTNIMEILESTIFSYFF